MSDLLENLPHMLIRGHLGLGDHLVLNAIYRHYARSSNVFLPCKRHNALTLNFMLRDIRNIEILPVEDDDDADAFCDVVEEEGHRVLKLGAYGKAPYSDLAWDRDSYRQAGLPFADRWNQFTCHRQPSRELAAPDGQYCFVHEDRSRGYVIDRTRLPKDLPVVVADQSRTQNLFDWWAHVEQATELHLIDSCFAIMADSLPELQARRLVVHLYARAGAKPPSYAKNWEILRQ